jgi:hypothetical protein
LLLDEAAADQLLKSTLWSEWAGVLAGGVEDGEANLFVDVAEENGVIVDDTDDAVESLRNGGCWGLSKGVWGLGSGIWGLGADGEGAERQGEADQTREREPE